MVEGGWGGWVDGGGAEGGVKWGPVERTGAGTVSGGQGADMGTITQGKKLSHQGAAKEEKYIS